MEIAWDGEGSYEIGYDIKSNRTAVVIDNKYIRPAEVDRLIGDPSKARRELGWTPEYTFDDLVKDMCLNGI
jgi:GDPmannose 4,6-dehydratase